MVGHPCSYICPGRLQTANQNVDFGVHQTSTSPRPIVLASHRYIARSGETHDHAEGRISAVNSRLSACEEICDSTKITSCMVNTQICCRDASLTRSHQIRSYSWLNRKCLRARAARGTLLLAKAPIVNDSSKVPEFDNDIVTRSSGRWTQLLCYA